MEYDEIMTHPSRDTRSKLAIAIDATTSTLFMVIVGGAVGFVGYLMFTAVVEVIGCAW